MLCARRERSSSAHAFTIAHGTAAQAPPAHAKHEKVSAALTNWGEQGRAGTTAVAHDDDTAAAQTPTKAHDDKPVASPTNNLLSSWGEGEQEQGPPA